MLEREHIEVEETEEVGFYFRSSLGIEAKLTLENFDRVPSTVELTEAHKDTAIIELPDVTEPDENLYFRSQKEFKSLIRYIRLKKNDGKVVETMEDLILRMDIIIEGF